MWSPFAWVGTHSDGQGKGNMSRKIFSVLHHLAPVFLVFILQWVGCDGGPLG